MLLPNRETSDRRDVTCLHEQRHKEKRAAERRRGRRGGRLAERKKGKVSCQVSDAIDFACFD